MNDADGTIRPVGALSAATPSFGSRLQQAAVAEGGNAEAPLGRAKQAGVGGKRSKSDMETDKVDPKNRKNSPATQESMSGNTPAVLPDFSGKYTAAWNIPAATPFNSAEESPALEVSLRTVSETQHEADIVTPAVTTFQPSDYAPFPIMGTAANALSVVADDASLTSPEAGSFPRGDASGEATPIDLPAVRNNFADSASMAAPKPLFAIDSGQAGAAVSLGDPVSRGKVGPIAGVGGPAGEDLTSSPKRLEATRAAGAKAPRDSWVSPTSGPAPDTGSLVIADNTVAPSGRNDLSNEEVQSGAVSWPGTLSAQVESGAYPVETTPNSGFITMDPGVGQIPASATGSTSLTDAAASRSKAAPGIGAASTPSAVHLIPSLTALSPLGVAPVTAGSEAQTIFSAAGSSTSVGTHLGRSVSSVSQEAFFTAVSPSLAGTHLVHTLQRSEMQVQVNAAEFGRVSVHAVYGRDGVSAQIGLENTALGSTLSSALSAHVSTLEEKIASHLGSRASVSVSTETGTGPGDGGRGQGGATPQRRSSPLSLQDTMQSLSTETATFVSFTPVIPSVGTSHRLDIRI